MPPLLPGLPMNKSTTGAVDDALTKDYGTNDGKREPQSFFRRSIRVGCLLACCLQSKRSSLRQDESSIWIFGCDRRCQPQAMASQAGLSATSNVGKRDVGGGAKIQVVWRACCMDTSQQDN